MFSVSNLAIFYAFKLCQPGLNGGKRELQNDTFFQALECIAAGLIAEQGRVVGNVSVFIHEPDRYFFSLVINIIAPYQPITKKPMSV